MSAKLNSAKSAPAKFGRLKFAVFLPAALALMTAVVSPQILAAQTSGKAAFAPVKYVNNQAITGYELSQRMGLLDLLGFNGDLRGEAMTGLIDDRLRNSAARNMGISLTAEQVMGGMEEFAARGSLDAAGFITAIGEQGIAPETFRDFVSAGLIWRQVISARYGDSFTVSEAAIDRALSNLNVAEANTVTLAEIILDASGDKRNQALALARDLQIDFIKGRSFSEAARAVSVGTSARAGGALPSKRLSELPKDIAILVRTLGPSQVSKPIILDDRLYMYQLIEGSTEPVAQTGSKVIDYAQITMAGGAAKFADLRRSVDDCDDLYTYAAKNSGVAVTRGTGLPAGFAGTLQLLDAGEISVPVATSAGAVAVMLCARGLDPDQTASRDEVGVILKNQRLAALAEVYLSELRAEALIRDP